LILNTNELTDGEGKIVDQHKARSGRIANLIGKHHKNNTVIATFNVMPVSVTKEVVVQH
jgi:hypothetical protein